MTLYKEKRLVRVPNLKVEPSHLLNVVVVFTVVIFSGSLVHTKVKIFGKIIEMKKIINCHLLFAKRLLRLSTIHQKKARLVFLHIFILATLTASLISRDIATDIGSINTL